MALRGAIVWGVLLMLVGALLAFTDIMLFESLGGILVAIGWILFIIGVIVLIALLVKRFLLVGRDEPRGRRMT